MTPRLDAELVRRGLARSRGHARELVLAGRVSVDGAPAAKVSTTVADGAEVVVAPAGPEWVGRAALKLVRAFEAFGPDGWSVERRDCVDVGASTGGFTQVLLHHGARSVLASLWNIPDVSTSELMKRFYTYLKEGKPKDEALQQAQSDLMRQPQFASPLYWAAFKLSGDWQ